MKTLFSKMESSIETLSNRKDESEERTLGSEDKADVLGCSVSNKEKRTRNNEQITHKVLDDCK